MTARHTVTQGDCMISIAERYGFFWETLWNLPENRDLREARKDPNALLPGDEVVVPDRKIQSHQRPTGARHTFRVKNVPARLRVRLVDAAEKPRAGLAFTLVIDGRTVQGTTDGDGLVNVPISPLAAHATLTLDGTDETYTLDLGHLDPVEDLRGLQARLRGLGIYRGPIDGTLSAATVRAIMEFQASVKLAPTGELDGGTLQALQDAFGT